MNAEHIDRLLRDHGIALWGIAANEPRMTLAPDLPRAISLVARHDPAAMDGVETEPTPAYYADYKRLNALLDEASAALAAALRAAGHAAEVVNATIYEDEYDAVEDWGASRRLRPQDGGDPGRPGLDRQDGAPRDAGARSLGPPGDGVHRR